MIEGNPLDINLRYVNGLPMNKINTENAINGTFFNTPKPASRDSIWQIFYQDGKALGGNSHTNSYAGHKRGTMVCFTDGSVIMNRYNNTNEFKTFTKQVKWAVGGNALYPDYNLNYEKTLPDIARNTYHTLMAYTKNKKILLLTTINKRSLNDCRKDLLNTFEIYSAINLDGGGSTSMKANSTTVQNQGRLLNNIIEFK